jgi:transposase
VIQTTDGKVAGRGEIPTTPAGFSDLTMTYKLGSGTRAALERGSVAFFVARTLSYLGIDPVVVDAYGVRAKAHRPTQKSDSRDAFELCEGLRRGIYRSIVHVPRPEICRLRETLSRRRYFVRVQSAQVVTAKGLLRARGLSELTRLRLLTDDSWNKLIGSLGMHPDLQGQVEHHWALWCCAKAQVATLEASLQTQVEKSFSDDVRRLQTIPGVGAIVASTAIAVLSAVGRFEDAKHVASYAGLVPSTHQSGDRDAHGRITKKGSGELRAMLREAAHHAGRPQHPLHPYFVRLCARRGYKTATIAVAHRLCRIIFAMLRNKADFDASKLRIEHGPFEQRIVRAYRAQIEGEWTQIGRQLHQSSRNRSTSGAQDRVRRPRRWVWAPSPFLCMGPCSQQ